MTTAFVAAAHGKMKLNKGDYYCGEESNIPSLELEYSNDGVTKTVISDDRRGDISKAFSIFTINNPLYAKPTGRNMGGFASRSAELYIQDVEVCTIPDKFELEYRFADIKRQFGKSTPNLSEFFSSVDGLEFILNNKETIGKCVMQKRLQKILSPVTSENVVTYVAILEAQPAVILLLNALKENYSLTTENAVKYIIQIIAVVKNAGYDSIQKALKWVRYKKQNAIVNVRLSEFNTTGLPLRASKHGDKLVISFGRANRMSNGERDVLSFVASLVAFESSLDKKPAILIMDEVFDYLDGTNLLAAQYYLSNMIQTIKKNNETVFPIIMTHLDPSVFSTYCFKKMAVHYLTSKSVIDISDNIVKLLFLRGQMRSGKDPDLEDLEKHMLHYHPANWTIPNRVKSQLPDGFWVNSELFREYVYSEVKDKYLNDLDYNALAVIIGLRIRVEEKAVVYIPEECRSQFYDFHGSREKLMYTERFTDELPEPFYLLQPLYNDALHLRNNGYGHEQETKNKIESAYLKTSSGIIKEMIREVFI